MIKNMFNIPTRNALAKEGDLRKGFYNATNMVNYYMANNSIGGAQLSSSQDRANLINFLTDGYLPTAITDALTGSEYSNMRRDAYGNQLQVAWHGIQIMQAQSITIRPETLSSLKNLVQKYKQDGGDKTTIDTFNKKLGELENE